MTDLTHAMPHADRHPGPAPLDYYLLHPAHTGTADGLLVEEFVRGPDHTTVGLRGARWTRDEGRWQGAASFSRALRMTPGLLARVRPVDRDAADAAYRALGGGALPPEATLRSVFLGHDGVAPLATAAPLRLGPATVPAGFRERQVYRVLFASGLSVDRPADPSIDPYAAARPTDHSTDHSTHHNTDDSTGRSTHHNTDDSTRRSTHHNTDDSTRHSTQHRTAGGDHVTWRLRRVGAGIAWGLDVTVLLASTADGEVGSVLRELTAAVRRQGLVPVTTERFA